MKSENNSMIEAVIGAIEETEEGGALFRADTPRGFSGDKIIGLLQRLSTLYSTFENTCYLEVGVFQGLTLLSVAHECKKVPCYGIDNFAYFDPDNVNLSIVEQGISSLGLRNVSIINKDYEDALEGLGDLISGNKIGCYFIDGPHDYRSQLMSLQLALPHLHEGAVIIVDDSNYQHVRQANRDFLITNTEWKLLFEAYTPFHPYNMTTEGRDLAAKGWWDGVNVLVRDKCNNLDSMFPPTERSRILYENEHLIQSSRLAEMASDAVYLAQSVYHGNPYHILKRFLKLVVKFIRKRVVLRSRFDGRNTGSEALPSKRFANIQN
ncbi:class I SAM-dependent methyltransferase [Candidatus Neomarinimicrobiota bacterium]